MIIHKHVMEVHTEEITRSEDDPRVFLFSCPECGEEYSVEGGPGVQSEETVDRFSHEIKMLVFDTLLNHLEDEHGY